MAPTLTALLQAAEGRSAELDAESASAKCDLVALEQDVADKRAEKTIAAQNAVRELLKQKEALMKKSKLLDGAAGHVRLAVSKLKRAKAAGLEDWKELREEKVKLSAFAQERLKDAAAVSQLEVACAGATISVQGGSVSFTGSSAGLAGLKAALEQLESGYSCTIEVDDIMSGILDRRGVLRRQADKHGVQVEKASGSVVITGAVDSAKKAQQAIEFLLGGRAELYCSRELAGAAKAQAREIEEETPCYVEVLRGGPGGGSIVHLRGDAESVKEAEDRMRAWFDEREGKYSIFLDVPRLAKLPPAKAGEFAGDLGHLGRNFGVEAWPCEEGAAARIEMRGPAGGQWEAGARAEFKQLSDWYAQQLEEVAKPKAKPKQEEDVWGAAPEAEFELGHKW